MKKMNVKGFTLIELLAVITIMGILMIVAIPAVTRTIENSRKDTFINTVQNYVNGAKNMWAADNLSCSNFVSSAVETGTYYIAVDSNSSSVPQLLESGGKSPWGSRQMKGYIQVVVEDAVSAGADGKLNGEATCDATGAPNTTGTSACVSNDDVTTRKVSYYPVISDGVHGVNMALRDCDGDSSTADTVCAAATLIESSNLKRGNLTMSGMTHIDVPAGVTTCIEV